MIPSPVDRACILRDRDPPKTTRRVVSLAGSSPSSGKALRQETFHRNVSTGARKMRDPLCGLGMKILSDEDMIWDELISRLNELGSEYGCGFVPFPLSDRGLGIPDDEVPEICRREGAAALLTTNYKEFREASDLLPGADERGRIGDRTAPTEPAHGYAGRRLPTRPDRASVTKHRGKVGTNRRATIVRDKQARPPPKPIADLIDEFST